MTSKHRRRLTVRGDEITSRRVAIYIRRSTDEDHQPFSLEAQETKLRAFVASQPGDWQIVAVYSDDASGATTDRPELQKALRAARAGLFDTMLVYRVDRFSRSLRDLTTLLDDLDEAEVVFRSATEPFDTSTPVGRMLVQMLGVFAEFERETIIDRVINGMERKAAKGLSTGGAPRSATASTATPTGSCPTRSRPEPSSGSSTCTPATGGAPKPSPESSMRTAYALEPANPGRHTQWRSSSPTGSTSARNASAI
jgi:DNA invertase Pin-like site-specific DNA recombinase